MAVGSSRVEGNLHVAGSLTAESMTLASGAVTDGSVQAAANVAASKLEHQYNLTVPLCDHATAAAAVRKVAHVVYGATGSVVAFGAGCTVLAAGGGNAVVDLKKNGTTILSSTITLDTGNTVNVLEDAAGFTSTSLVAGDVLEVSIESVAATEPKGVFAHLVIREKAD